MGYVIAQVIPSFHPMIGGIEIYLLNLSRELVKRGHEVHVYTAARVMGKRLTPFEDEIDGVKIHRLPVILELSFRLKLWPSLYDRLLKDNFDLIHIQGHDHTSSITAAIAGRVKKAPIVVNTYGPIYTQTTRSFRNRFLFDVYDATATPIIFRLADRVLAKYAQLISWIKSYGVPDWKIGLAPSGIPSECLTPRNGRSFRERYGIEGQIILYIGRISPQKGVQHLITATSSILERVPDVTVVLVGPDYIDYKAHLIKMAKQFQVCDHVKFIPPIYNLDEEMEAYAACDVFVMPSSFEGFSQGIHKAWAQGKPVVATAVGMLRYQIENGKDGLLVNYGDHKLMAKAIVNILQNPKTAMEYGRDGLSKTQAYTYDKLAVDMERIYEKVVNRTSLNM